MPNAIVTGASRGLGLAFVRVLSEAGWHVIADARGRDDLEHAVAGLSGVTAISGDVTDAAHREALVAAATSLDLLVNNAGALGPSPLPPVAEVSLQALRDLYETNVIAPVALTQLALPLLRAARGIVINITSDAAVEAYAGWGAYGSSKAALERLGAVLGAEAADVTVWQLDPGDLRTRMHQDAYPGEDISDRPLPETVAPALLDLLKTKPESGRYRLSDRTAG